jgi:hypothetical protein
MSICHFRCYVWYKISIEEEMSLTPPLSNFPPPSPQKSDNSMVLCETCSKFRRAAPFLQDGILDSYKSVPPGNLAWSRQAIRRFDPGTLLNQCRLYKNKEAYTRPVQIGTSKIVSLAFWEIECRGRGDGRSTKNRQRTRAKNRQRTRAARGGTTLQSSHRGLGRDDQHVAEMLRVYF